MHEGAVCQEILSIAQQAAQENGLRSITDITLAVGPLSCIQPSQLLFYFEVAKQGTMAQEAVLTIQPDDTITGIPQEYVRSVEGEDEDC